MYLHATEAVISKMKDPQVTYMVERLCKEISGVSKPAILRGMDLDFDTDLSNIKNLTCSQFCLKSKSSPTTISVEVNIFLWHDFHVGDSGFD